MRVLRKLLAVIGILVLTVVLVTLVGLLVMGARWTPGLAAKDKASPRASAGPHSTGGR